MAKTEPMGVRLQESTYMEVANIAAQHQVPISTVVSAMTTHAINQLLDQNGTIRQPSILRKP